MKKLLIVLLVLISCVGTAFAGGKLTIKPVYDMTASKWTMVTGLGIYQKLIGPIAYNSWSGMGETKTYKDLWYTSKHAIDINLFKNVQISTGLQFDYVTLDKQFNTSVFAGATITLW